MRTHPSPVLGTFARVIPRTTVSAIVPLVGVCLPLLSLARGKRAGSEISSLAFHDLGVTHILGDYGG